MYNRFYRQRGQRRSSGNGKSNWEIVRAIHALQAAPKQDTVVETYTPRHKFNDFAISENLKANISSRNFVTPTPIQDQAISLILDNRDLIGIANTGTGKTAAFLIPLIEKVSRDTHTRVLIITPTRELAMQISDELYGFTHNMKVSWALCVGGTNRQRQKYNLQRNPDFVVGTPGRLRDFSQSGGLRLAEFNIVVLDEADRMVDMGFIADVKYFIARLPEKRQSLFFSATIPPKVSDILRSFVKDPATVSVRTRDTVENITQEIVSVDNQHTKIERLHSLLIKEEFERVLVFGRTKWGVQRLSDELINRGFSAAAIHGNKTQAQRLRALEDFKCGRIAILLATDVASRGIDIPDVSHVINYDIPNSYEDYIHRIGRTGRADKKGTALTFIEN